MPPTRKRAATSTAIQPTAKQATAKKATAKKAGATAPPRPTATSAKRAAATHDVLAAGAARASGERARRRGTPLVAVVVPDPVSPSPAPPDSPAVTTERDDLTGVSVGRRAPAKHRPKPVPRTSRPSARVVAREGGRQGRPPRTLQPVPDPPVTTAPPVGAGESSRAVVPGLEDLVQAGVAALRTVVAASGAAPDDVDQQVARTLAFVRRRLTGDFEVDDYGFDEDFTVNAYLPFLRPLYNSWFRVEVRGIENIPADGGGLVVANHSGTLAFDSLMTQVAVYDESATHRHLRMLGADDVFKTPVVSQVARKSGSTLAANADAERLLGAGELVGVWPEGFKGIGKPFSERYKLQRFGRGGFVASAIRAGVPIIPCSIVGAEEIYPMLGNLKTLARLVGAPYAPVTPTWPLLGPLGLIPLPSKWIIEFGVPVNTADLGHGAADDPMLIFDLTDRVRETIQQTLYSLLMQRRSVFF
jgi:1-acyl-sn-glycerol-3-phosphate acyltransferase